MYFNFIYKLPFKIFILLYICAALLMEILLVVLCIADTIEYFPPLLLLILTILLLINKLHKSTIYDISSLKAFLSS